MVSGFHRDSLTSICASEGSRSLMGGSIVVNCVRLVVDSHSRWHESWVHSTSWDCCTLHSTVHYWWNNGGLSLIIVLMGPPPQCSGYIW